MTETVVFSNVGNSSSSSGSSGIQTASVTVTSAQLLSLASNPITIIPAPGVGKMLIVMSPMIYAYHPGTVPYTAASGEGFNLWLMNSSLSVPLWTATTPVVYRITGGVSMNGTVNNMTPITQALTVTMASGAIPDLLNNAACILGIQNSGSSGPLFANQTSLLGVPSGISIAYPGNGYVVGNVIQITGFLPSSPGALAQYTVSSVNGTGGVTGVTPLLSASHSAILTFPAKYLITTAISGSGQGCYLNITSIIGGQNGITASNVTSGHAGTGYAVGDTGTVTFAGTAAATYIVNTVSSGAVATYSITSVGQGYIIAGAYVTATGGAQAGVGTGFEIDVSAIGGGYAVNDTGTIGAAATATYIINSVDANGNVLTYTVTSVGTGYSKSAYLANAKGGAQPGIGAGFSIMANYVSTDVTLGDGTMTFSVPYTIVNIF
jgi:hypothetical protein